MWRRPGTVQTINVVNNPHVILDPNADYPIPGSGSYQTAAAAFSGMTYSTLGTPAALTGNIATVPNSTPGLWRRKYNGNYMASPGTPPSGWDMNFFNTATYIHSIADTYVSWGSQIDTPAQQNFSMEFKGYFKVPTTQNYNVYASVDDDCAVWMGTNALDANFTNSNTIAYGSNQTMPNSPIHNTNSLSLTSGQWYPIRIWMTEFQGATRFQLFFQGANGSNYNGSGITLAYNSATGGF